MKRKLQLVAVILAAAVTAAPLAIAQGPASQPDPTPVVVINQTRFEPIAQAEVVPAGQTSRFEIRSGGFARASLLAGGRTIPDSGRLRLVTLFGPPQVPSGEPRPLHVNPEGRIHGKAIQPVLGPVMVILVHNDSTADAVLDLSVYLSN